MEVLVIPADADQPEGPEVVRKTASLPGERTRLLREAEVLQVASERGVAGLAALVASPAAEAAEPSLVTSAVAGPSLAVAAPLPILEVAGVVAEVARLLAGLHEAGLVHGAVEPSHVVLDGAGGAILVGLGDGGPVGAASLDASVGVLDPAGDVAGWGMLVSHLLDWSAAGDEDPLGALRLGLSTRRGGRGGRQIRQGRPGEDERRILAALADQAQDPDPARRPAARSLAAAVAHRIPGARVPGAVPVAAAPRATGVGSLLDRLSAHLATAPPPASDAEAAGPSPRPEAGDVPPARPARRRRGGVGRRAPQVPPVLVPSVRATPAGPRPVEDEDARPAGAAPPRPPARHRRRLPTVPGRWVFGAAVVASLLLVAPAAVARFRTTTERSPAAAGASPLPCAPATAPAADVDGDGCEEAVRFEDGVLQAGAARFALGAPGAAWAVGDWDCDGRRTLAVLDRGSLAVFDAWPVAGGELQGRPVATASGFVGVVAVPGPDGCDRPSLSRPGAADLLVDSRKRP